MPESSMNKTELVRSGCKGALFGVSAGVLLMLAGCAEPPPAVPAQQVASDFYQAYLLTGASGVPSAEQRHQLAPFLTEELLQLLGDAAAAEARYAAAQTEPSPPLLQGDVFSSLFEGATGVEVKACKEVTEKAACQILLAYTPPGQTPAHWQDILYLERTDAGWRISDLEYGGDWPFGNKGSLQATLQQLISEAPAK